MSNQAQNTLRDSSDYWFSCTDTKVIRDKQLSPMARFIFTILCSFATLENRGGWPKNETVADIVGVSVKTIKRAYQELAARGVIARLSRFKDDGSQTSSYTRIIGHNAPCYSEGGTQETPYRDIHDPAPRTHMTHEGNHMKDIKDSLTGENSPSAELPIEPQSEIPVTPKQESPINPEESYTPGDAPEAMRSTAEYFLFKTGRKTLTEKDISALCEMNGHQYPVRVQKEIETACERFKRRGQPLTDLTLEYIASSLRNQPTRGRKAKSQQAKSNPNPNALTQSEIDGRRRKFSLDDLKRAEEMLQEWRRQ